MNSPIEASRNSCTLHGALQTIEEIQGVVPIVHSTTGCSVQKYLGVNYSSGFSGTGYTGGLGLPCSNVIEKQVIFGGTSRLREQIKNAVKVIKGDLYVVLSGCTTELVGDDALSMAREAQGQGYPVIYVKTPGFLGDIHVGYEIIVKGIINQLSEIFKIVSKEKIKGLVNIFGIIPKQDIYWKGNLGEIKRILGNLDLKVNTLFGFNENIEKWNQIPQAELNLIFSPHGLSIAKYLQEKYNTPYLYLNNLPVGAEDTTEFVLKVAEKLKIDLNEVNDFLEVEEKQVYYYIENILDIYLHYNFQKEFAIIGEGNVITGISKFLANTFGFIPKTIIVTEAFNKNYDEELSSIFKEYGTKIYFTEDRGKIRNILKKEIPEIILGSSLEEEISDSLNVPLHIISFPSTDKVILSKSYAGYKGAITLLEDLTSEIIKIEKKFNIEIENNIKHYSMCR